MTALAVDQIWLGETDPSPAEDIIKKALWTVANDAYSALSCMSGVQTLGRNSL